MTIRNQSFKTGAKEENKCLHIFLDLKLMFCNVCVHSLTFNGNVYTHDSNGKVPPQWAFKLNGALATEGTWGLKGCMLKVK
jgi:hypothetical protein